MGNTENRVGIFVLAALGIFAYMGFKIGAFRFDRGHYAQYTMYFKDVSGLSKKADVKIAGVKVGWVEDIGLEPDNGLKAEASVMVLRDYKLHSDAYAVVRQEGLLGAKYLELIPGDSLLPQLKEGQTLSKPSKSPVSIDELMSQFQKIAGNVEEITDSFRGAVGGVQGKEQLQSMFENFNLTAEKMARFSEVLERSFVRNEDNLDSILQLGNDLRRLADRLDKDVLPSFQENIDKIANVFDRDFNRIATKLEAAAGAMEEASIEARDGLRNVSSIAEKIDEGKGLLGKLVNEDETYRDLKVAVQGLRNYFAKVDRMEIIFDTHFESMHRRAENYDHEDTKGYFDVRIYPNDDHFFVIQMATSEKGFAKRYEIRKNYTDLENNKIDTDTLVLTDDNKLENVFNEEITIVPRDRPRIGLQFGKMFHHIALRAGLFDGTAGVAMDFDIPFQSEKLRWVMSFEFFDFKGRNRIDDRRPHLKWLNKMFFMRNLYVVFGADDFVSKRNANAFFGGGLRFGDDDVKYLISGLSGAAMGGGNGASFSGSGVTSISA